MQHWLAVWFSGNALVSINVVPLRQTRLVPGWVTVCGHSFIHIRLKNFDKTQSNNDKV